MTLPTFYCAIGAIGCAHSPQAQGQKHNESTIPLDLLCL